MKSLEGKRAVVTGGSRGLGLGITHALAAEKVHVVVVARDPGRLDAVGKELGVETVAADIADDAAAGRILRDAAPDLVVLCAGASPPLGSIHEQTWESFSHNWEVDAKSTFFWLRHALRLPLKAGSHVIVVSSGAAVRGSPVSGGYASAKRAQWFMAELRGERGAAGEDRSPRELPPPEPEPEHGARSPGHRGVRRARGGHAGGVREALRSAAHAGDHGPRRRRARDAMRSGTSSRTA